MHDTQQYQHSHEEMVNAEEKSRSPSSWLTSFKGGKEPRRQTRQARDRKKP